MLVGIFTPGCNDFAKAYGFKPPLDCLVQVSTSFGDVHRKKAIFCEETLYKRRERQPPAALLLFTSRRNEVNAVRKYTKLVRFEETCATAVVYT